MSIPNMNSKVYIHKGIVKGADHLDEKEMSVSEAMNAIRYRDTYISDAKKEENKLRMQRIKEEQEKLSNAKMKRVLIENKINTITPQIKDIIFRKVMSKIVIEALVIDKSFVMRNRNNFINMTNKYIDNFGGYKRFIEVNNKLKSPILESISVICDDMTEKITDRKLLEAQEQDMDNEDIDLLLTDEENDEIEDICNNMNVEKVSQLVKSKVIEVIKDENEREAKEKEFIEDIKSEVEDINEKEDEDDVDVEESVQAYINLQRDPNIKQATLFSAIMNQTYRNLIEGMDPEDDEEELEYEDDSDDDFDEDDLFIEDDDDDDIMESLFKEDKNSINMDSVLGDTVAKYTVMEVFHTLGLERKTNAEVKQICLNIMNPV